MPKSEVFESANGAVHWIERGGDEVTLGTVTRAVFIADARRKNRVSSIAIDAVQGKNNYSVTLGDVGDGQEYATSPASLIVARAILYRAGNLAFLHGTWREDGYIYDWFAPLLPA